MRAGWAGRAGGCPYEEVEVAAEEGGGGPNCGWGCRATA